MFGIFLYLNFSEKKREKIQKVWWDISIPLADRHISHFETNTFCNMKQIQNISISVKKKAKSKRFGGIFLSH